MGSIGSSLGTKSAARQSQGLGRSRRKAIKKLGGAEWFNKWFKEIAPGMQKLYEPERVQAADQAAIGEQRGLEQVDVAAGRAGLGRSGAQLMARAGERGTRQALTGNALINSYLKGLSTTGEQAGEFQRSLLGAISGQSYPPINQSNMLGQGLDMGSNALALYLMNRGGQQSPYQAQQPWYSPPPGYQPPGLAGYW